MPKPRPPDDLAKALAATREARSIDFKSRFDPTNTRDWCELLKDIFAFANSGGGVVLVGVDEGGAPIAGTAAALLKIDPADVGNKIRSYTGSDFDELEIVPEDKDGVQIGLIRVGSVSAPLIPTRPGTYEKEPAKQVTAFSVGVVYMRHGAKSEPATTADLARFIERRVREQRRAWLTGIRKVTAAPTGSVVTIGRPIVPSDDARATPVRLTLDPSAPATSLPDYDRTHPHRMTELLKVLNERIREIGTRVTAPGVRTVLEAYDLESNVAYTWKPKHGTQQYTTAFVDWLEERIRADRRFIMKARNKLLREGGRLGRRSG
jgi:Putative DNA-binding domain